MSGTYIPQDQMENTEAGQDATLATIGGCPISVLWPFLTSSSYEWSSDAGSFALVNKDCGRAVARFYELYLVEIKKKWKWLERHEEMVGNEGPLKIPRVLVSRLTRRRVYTLGGSATPRTLSRYDYQPGPGSGEMSLKVIDRGYFDFKKKACGTTSYKYDDGFSACWHQGRLYAGGSFGCGGHMECYNPLTNKWSDLPPIDVCTGALVSHEGQLLMTGGVDPKHKRLNTIMALVDNDDHDKGWEKWKYSLPVATKSHSAVSAGGLLLMIGGMRGEDLCKNPVMEVDCLIDGKWHKDKISIKQERYSPGVYVNPDGKKDGMFAHRVLIYGGDIDRLSRLPDTFEGFTVLTDPMSTRGPFLRRIQNPWADQSGKVPMSMWEWFHFNDLRNYLRYPDMCKAKGCVSCFYDGTASLGIQI